MELFLFWFALAVVVAIAASSKGRSSFGWFLLAVVISPLIAGLIVLVLPSLKEPPVQKVEVVSAPQPSAGGTKKCPDCAELVQADARVCRYCRHEFYPAQRAPESRKQPDPDFKLPPIE